MKTIKYLSYIVLCTFALAFTACEPRALTADDVFTKESELDKELSQENPEGYKIYTLNEFLDKFMTEQGNFWTDTSQYRSRATNGNGLYLFSVDTLPTNGEGIYIRGRVTTDDWAGNFYKSIVIQQVVNGEQQNLRISVDLGSVGGMYELGQEIIIRCNGLAVGRYANQPQLCVPSYNNNIFAYHAEEKVGWAPGRIPGAVFRRQTKMIGLPNAKAIKYDTLTLDELYAQIDKKPTIDAAGMDKVRKADGRLVTLKKVYFTGQYSNYGVATDCDTQHPDTSSNANVFAPTTGNIGYPQGRIFSNGTNSLICSSSEYAKYAHHYLPGANKDGIADCADWVGYVTGILGWYMDNAQNLTVAGLTDYDWSVTPRGIMSIGVPDVTMWHKYTEEEWIPQEFNPQNYNH